MNNSKGKTLFALASLICFFTASAYGVTSSVGTTPGKFDVNNNGAATYTVPIQVSPGFNGIEPKLALVYNSQQGNGLVGVGWSLSGLSTISRCPKTIAIDDTRSGINFNGSEFCWDGQRLIPRTSGGSQLTGTDGGVTYYEYRTEIESFARIAAYTSSTAPTKFKIWTKDGRILTFGDSSDSLVNPQTKGTLIWALNREEDRKGNYLTITYGTAADDSEYWPATIQYSGADATVLSRTVVFGMDATQRTDTITKYVSGELLVTTKRLKTVTAKMNGNTVRTYTLNYAAEATTAARSLLSSIQECGNDGVCYSTPLTFTPRAAGSTSLTNATTATLKAVSGAGNSFGQWNVLADMNGDGIMDIFKVTTPSTGVVAVMLGKAGGGYNAAVSTTGVMTNETTSGSGFSQWNELADVNGDGLIDIFRVIIPGGGSVADARVYLGQPNGTFNTSAITLTGVVSYNSRGFRYLNQLVDMNGDGLMDLFSVSGQNVDIRSGSTTGSYSLSAPSTKSSVLASYSSGTAEGFRATNQLADANGDGLVDILRSSGDQISISLAQPDGSFVITTGQSGVLAPSGAWGGYANYISFLNQFVDVNGDGVLDVVRMADLATPTGQGSGVLVYTSSTYTGNITDGGFTYVNALITPQYYAYTKAGGTTLKIFLGNGNDTYISQSASSAINMGNTTFAPTTGPVDQTTCPQRAVTVTNYNSSTGQYSLAVKYLGCTPTGYAVSDPNFKGLSHYNQFADMDGDGYVDLVQMNSTGNVTIAFGKGDGSFTAPTASLATLVATNGFRAWNQLADMNGDGVPDLFAVNGSTTGTPKISQRAQPGLMASATDGNGLVTTVTYQPLSTTTAYIKTTSPADVYPVRRVQMPQYVVTSTTDSQSGLFSYVYNYKYTDARVDMKRGWLGFATMTRTDTHTALETTTTFNQNFPYTGRPSLQTLRSTGAGAGQYLSSTSNSWADRADTNVNSSGKVHFVYPTGGAQTVYEPNSSYAAVLTTTTSNLDNPITGNYDATPFDQYGNPEKVQVTYSDGHALSTVYSNTYLSSSLHLGQLSQQDTTVTHTTPAPGSETKTRVTRDTYYADGLLNTKISQPNTGDTNHELSLTSTYGYDANGRVNSLSVAGADPSYDATGNASASPNVNRSTTYSYGTEAATSLTVTKTTAVSGSSNHLQTLIYDPRYGAQSGYTDPAGVATQWGYDGFGRKVLEKLYSSSAQPVSTVTDFFAATDTTNCPALTGVKYCIRATRSGTVTTLSAVTSEFDSLGRELRTISKDAANANVYNDTQFDGAGRVWKVSRPYYSGTPLWVVTTYDIASRPLVITAPNTATTTNTYNGLTTTVTRAAGGEASQATTAVKDSQAQIVQVTDALVKSTSYKYGPFGMLETITDANGNVISLGYDIFGNKTSQSDADSGLWQYRYNAFGELKWQKDAKAQITSYQYDYRGRVTNRSDDGGVATLWTYDTASSGTGRLDNVTRGSGPSAITQGYTYDPITGQARTTTNTLNSSAYNAQTDYDDLGRPQAITYPGAALKVKYSYYANGALKNIADYTTPTTIYWSATSYNADGLPTAENWGNGLTGSRGYDANTGALTGITTGTVQNLSYSYYKLGNLNTRTNGLSAVTETFSYDVLNRLTDVTSTAAGVAAKHFGYDALGNITSKTGVGSYTYDGPRPHAVTAITPSGGLSGDANNDGSLTTADTAAILGNILNGTALAGNGDCNGDSQINVLDILCDNTRIAAPTYSYTYDANGNVTNGGGRVITYTTFNMPFTVDYNGVRETYTYGPGYTRLSKQVTTLSSGAVTQTTTYLGKLYERIDRSGAIEERFYIATGDRLVAEMSKTGSTTTLYYIHTDLLGSAETVTDAAKAVVDNLSFDAWGLARQSNWQDGAPVSAFNQTTRGYTGHETDIASGLINMNARLYDPVLGRFMQADTVIPNVFNPQALNPYTYVLNNPFGYTDPTGHNNMGLDLGVGPISNGISAFDTGGDRTPVASYNWGTGAYSFADGSMIDAQGNYYSPSPQGQSAFVNNLAVWANDVGTALASATTTSGGAGNKGGVNFYAGTQSSGTNSYSYAGSSGGNSYSYSDGASGGQGCGGPGGSCHPAAASNNNIISPEQFIVGVLVGENPWSLNTKTENYNVTPEPGLVQTGFGPIEYAMGGPRILTTKFVANSASRSRALTSYDPPNDGFLGAGRDFTLIPGARVDRYGRDAGRFLAPEGTPVPMRALPPGTTDRPYSVFEVVKPLQVKAGEIAPAYGQPGLGTQFVTDQAVRDLISGGYLKRVQP